MFKILSTCKGGGYRYCRTDPPHPRANAKGLYPLHRVLMENRLGRLLEPNEVVHHRDGNTNNDDENNLRLLTRSDHAKHHVIKAKPLKLKCPICGNGFELVPHVYRARKKASKRGELTCSRQCGGVQSGRYAQLKPLPPHGTNRRYTSKRGPCRCDLCRRARREKRARYARRKRSLL